MKKRARSKVFLKELRNLVGALKQMKPGETHILSIDANYGRYQLMIGPGRDGESEDHRPIEIDGEIHHLFMTPEEVRLHPSKRQVKDSMKDTVIMRGLHVHLMDPEGDGDHLARPGNGGCCLKAKEYINLAGKEGERMIDEMEHGDEISQDTYRIIQEDIINTLKRDKKKAVGKRS